MLSVENNAQLQKSFLPTRPETSVSFTYTEMFYRSVLLIVKILFLCPLGKKYRGLVIGPLPGPDENNKPYHVLSLYLSFVISYKLE